MLEAPLQAVGVFVLHLFKPGQLFGLGLFQHRSGRRRDDRDGHDEGGHQAVADAQGHGLHQVADGLRGEDDGQEDADRGEGRGHDRHAHLLCALHRRAGGGHTAAPQAVDVLDDDDGVIHQHTDAEGEARQRHDVHIQPGEVHEHHRKQHGKRDADANHEGGLDVFQEDGQHDDGQRRTHDHAGKDALDDDGDVVALVGQHDHMQALVLGLQLLKGGQAVAGHVAGAGRAALEDLQHRRPLAVQAGIAGLGVVDDFHIRHIGEADIAKAIHMEQQGSLNVGDAVVLLAHLQQPALAAGILDVTGGHGEVLGIDEGGQRVDVQLLCHVGAGKGLFLRGFVLGLRRFVLSLVVVQHIAGIGKFHVGGQLLAGVAAQRLREAVQQLGHIVHGLDGIFQCFIDGTQALLHLGAVHAGGRLAGAAIQPALQLLQGHSQAVGDIAQLADHRDEGIDVPHARLVELVHHVLQAVADVHKALLDVGVVDDLNELVDAVQQVLRLIFHRLHRRAHFRAHLGHDGVGDGVAVFFHLLFVFGTACVDLGLGLFQLFMGGGQLGVDGFQQLFVDDIDLFLVQLHLHHFLDKAVGRHAGNAALALHVGHQRIADEVGKVVDVAALPAHGHRHKGIHVQAVFQNGRRQAGIGQAGHGLVHLIGHLDHGAVHVRALAEFEEQQVVVFRRGGGDGVHTGHRAQRIFHHIGHFALHALGAGTGIYRDHHEVRGADIRQQVGLHVAQGHKAQQQHHDHTHQDREWFFDTEFFHFFLPFLLLHAPHAQE